MRDHVLRRAHAGAVPGEALGQLRLDPGPPRHGLVDARDLARVERLAQLAAAERTEQPPVGDAAALQPLGHQRYGVGRDVEHGALALGVGLAAAHQHGGRAGPVDREVAHLQGRQFRAAQHGVVGDGQERAVADVDRAVPRRLDQSLPERPGEAGRLRLAASPVAVHALQGELHRRALRRLRPADRPVRRRDAGDVAAHGGRRAGRRHGVHEGGDRVGSGGQRPVALFGAPCPVDAHIGLQRAPGVGAERAFRGLHPVIGQLPGRGGAVCTGGFGRRRPGAREAPACYFPERTGRPAAAGAAKRYRGHGWNCARRIGRVPE